MPSVNDYVEEVQQIFRSKGFHADIDVRGETMQKKIRMGQLAQYNFIFGKFVISNFKLNDGYIEIFTNFVRY